MFFPPKGQVLALGGGANICLSGAERQLSETKSIQRQSERSTSASALFHLRYACPRCTSQTRVAHAPSLASDTHTLREPGPRVWEASPRTRLLCRQRTIPAGVRSPLSSPPPSSARLSARERRRLRRLRRRDLRREAERSFQAALDEARPARRRPAASLSCARAHRLLEISVGGWSAEAGAAGMGSRMREEASGERDATESVLRSSVAFYACVPGASHWFPLFGCQWNLGSRCDSFVVVPRDRALIQPLRCLFDRELKLRVEGCACECSASNCSREFESSISNRVFTGGKSAFRCCCDSVQFVLCILSSFHPPFRSASTVRSNGTRRSGSAGGGGGG